MSKKYLFKILSLALIFSHLLVFCLRDLAFAFTPLITPTPISLPISAQAAAAYHTLGLTKLTYPDGEAVTYEYNPQGIERVYAITQQPNNAITEYVSNIAYSPTAQITKLKYGNGAHREKT